MTPKQKLAQQAAIARHHRAAAKVEQQQWEETRTEFSATIISYNSASGLYCCRLEDGGTIFARSITPYGSVGLGSVVSLYRPAVGIPTIKAL